MDEAGALPVLALDVAPGQHVLDACRTRSIPCGIHIADLEWLAEWQAWEAEGDTATAAPRLGFIISMESAKVRFLWF